jgi:hypothetical protein
MQRKGTMGMNAILSLSLALARLSAAVNGKDLWSGIRDQMTETMAKAIASGGGTKILPPELAQRVGSGAGEEAWRAIKAGLTMDELEQGLKALAKAKPKDVKLHEILRQHLPVYG